MMMMLKGRPIVAAAAATVLLLLPLTLPAACSSSDDAATPFTSDAGGVDEASTDDAAASDGAGNSDASLCTFPTAKSTSLANASCPSACEAIAGAELNEKKNCLQQVFVGCIACPAGGCKGDDAGSADAECFKYREDNRLVNLPARAVANQPEWTKCTKKEADKFNGLIRCLGG